jgi:hypothetical protein
MSAGRKRTPGWTLSVARSLQLDYVVSKAQRNNMNKMLHAVVLVSFERLTVWYWRAVELLDFIRRRADVIISSALIGLLVAMTFTAAIKPVFSSRAKVRVVHITNPESY